MIFKTINSSIDSSRKSITLFNKDWNTYINNLKNVTGIKTKALSIISSNDVNCLKAYNQQITNGIKPSEAYKNTMTSCTKEASQQAVAIAKGTTTIDAATKSIKESTFAAKANKVAMSAMSTALNVGAFMLVTTTVSKLISVFSELIHSKENLKQFASDLGTELLNSSSDIESYKKKIEELKAVINDSSSSFAEVSQAKVDLMTIQDELIEKFGTEKGIIESITLAINEQTDTLIELNRKAYYQKKNEFNEKTDGDKFSDWLSFGNTNDDRVQSNMDKMVNEMRYSYYNLETTGIEILDNLIAKSYGLNIVDDMYGNGKHFQVYGTLDEIKNKLYGIQELSQDFDLSTSFENSFTQILNEVDDALAKYKNLYNQYVLYEKILTDNPNNQYDKQFDQINKAKEALNEAKKLGDSDKIKTASDEYAQTLQSAIDLAMQSSDSDVADYFKSMYPELQKILGEWRFSIDFEPNTDGLKDQVASALDSIDGVSDGTATFSVEDIENFNPNNATQEQIDAYGELTNVAEYYGLTIKQLISLLQIMGLVQSESYQQLVDTFGQESIDKLSPEDLQIAYTIENAGSMTFEDLQTEIQKSKESANETTVSSSISQTIDQLNTHLKPAFDSLKSAYQNIFTDDEFDLNSIDILSTCDSIKSKLDELNQMEDVTVDYSAFEDFVKILRNTESEADDVETAFDSLAASILQAALSGTEDFETMKTALEDLGVVNSEMTAFDALASNAKMLDEALSQANASMDDFVVNTEDGSVEATKAGRAFLEEKVGAENCVEALNILAFHKQLCNLQEMNTAEEVANLRTLAENAGYTGEVIRYLTELEQIYQDVASGTLNPVQLGAKIARAAVLQTLIKDTAGNINYEPTVDFSSATKAAGSAGQDAGKSYKDGLKEELSNLDSIISGITKSIDGQIDVLNEEKETALEAIDAQIDALESERDARLEVVDAQKKQLEEQIELIDKQIKSKQDEIDAINDAAEARKREMDLQKAQYDLERMQNQRTILQYSKEKGMHYAADEQGIRDAREEVDEAKRQITIAGIEKEIDLLEGKKDLLNEQIDLLDIQAEKINEFYDTQIKFLENQKEETEKYFETLTNALEDSKSKYTELSEIVNKAELSAKLKQLGIDEEALLNGSEAEFQKLKDNYMGIVFQLNEGNDAVLSKLGELSGYSGTAPAVLSDSNIELDAMNGKLNDSNQSIGNINSFLTDTASKTSEAATNIETIANGLSQISDNQSITNLSGAFDALSESIGKVADALGLNGESKSQTIGSLMQAIDDLNTAELDINIIKQFTNLKTAIDSVSSAISGGGSDSPGGDPAESSSKSMSYGADGGDGSKGNGKSLTDAITDIGTTANKVIGAPEAEGDGTVIGEFGSLESAVNDVTAAIGSGDAVGGQEETESSDNKSESNLIDSIISLGDQTGKILGEPGGDGVIGRFEEFKKPIGEADEHVNSISESLDTIDGKNVECTITVNVKQNGSAAITPLQAGNSMYDLTQKWDAYFGKTGNKLEALALHSAYEHSRQMQDAINQVTNSQITTKNQPNVRVGDIHITCPGVTSKEVAKQVGVELNHMFNGLHLDADQQSRIR